VFIVIFHRCNDVRSNYRTLRVGKLVQYFSAAIQSKNTGDGTAPCRSMSNHLKLIYIKQQAIDETTWINEMFLVQPL